MNKVAESIYSGQSIVVALAEVQHVESAITESKDKNIRKGLRWK